MTENFKSKLDADVKLINDTIQNFCSCGYLKASGSPQDKVIEAENYSQILEVQNLMYIEEAFADALDYVSFM